MATDCSVPHRGTTGVTLFPPAAQNTPAARQVEGDHAGARAREGWTDGGTDTMQTGAWSRHRNKDKLAEVRRETDKTSNPH